MFDSAGAIGAQGVETGVALEASGTGVPWPGPPGRNVPAPGRSEALIDRFGRRIDHLRLSVTSQCDLRCVYCRPGRMAPDAACGTGFTDGARLELIRFLHERFGLSQVRITGGEPLLFPRLIPLIAGIGDAVPACSIAMTTNGRSLSRVARRLRDAGLDRLNVSVDSLNPATYRRVTAGRLSDVLAGLDAAADAGFPPPKINTVVLRGLNDDEIPTLAAWAMNRKSEIRFLEVMPIGPAAESNRRAFVAASEIRGRLAERFKLTPLPKALGDTATRFRATDGVATGVVATIAPVSEPFCSGCRRMRVTESGSLFPCLLDRRCIDLRRAWHRDGFDRSALEELVVEAARTKPFRGDAQPVPMIRLGG